MYKEIVGKLRDNIYSTLAPLINNDYVHIDIPYHYNIGDVFIWQGEISFLNSIGHKCLKMSSAATWRNMTLEDNEVIIMHGGGNFGDLYRNYQEFRLRIIEQYPNNRIIIFPQSVWYDDMSLVSKDSKIMSRHKDLHICARDQWSYNFLLKYFPDNEILLVPDMAFCISDTILEKYRLLLPHKESAYYRRLDKELIDDKNLKLPPCVEIHDWPTFEKDYLSILFLLKMNQATHKIRNIHILHDMIAVFMDAYACHVAKDKMIDLGFKSICSYKSIITTRLHVLIGAILIGRPVQYIDNVTGKISSFVETWLSDTSSVNQLCPIK